MYIIVAGGGKVGYYLSKTLITEGHEVLVIEQDAKKAARINEELGSIVMRGDACEATTLADAGTERADMIIAVTGDDEDNLVICQMAKAKFNVPRTIARINNPKNEHIFKTLGIDVTVSSTNVILEHIEHELPSHPLIHLMELQSLGLEIVEVRIPSGAPVIGRSLRELSLPTDSILVASISKDRGAVVPSGDTVFRPGDVVIAVTRVESEAAIRQALTGL